MVERNGDNEPYVLAVAFDLAEELLEQLRGIEGRLVEIQRALDYASSQRRD